jgi:hypothetical protein
MSHSGHPIQAQRRALPAVPRRIEVPDGGHGCAGCAGGSGGPNGSPERNAAPASTAGETGGD